MMIKKIGLLKEGKTPPDKRVPLSPSVAKLVESKYQIEIKAQKSEPRTFDDAEFTRAGIEIVDDLKDCDVLMGVKEVKIKELIADKTYFFFSHTIKKQAYNRDLLHAILDKNIRLIDYECITDKKGNRIIGFGRYAGIVGAYNAIRGYGLKKKLFVIDPPEDFKHKSEVVQKLTHLNLPTCKLLVTGGGRAANGAMEILGAMGIRKVTPFEFSNFEFEEPVFAQLRSRDYVEHKDNIDHETKYFYEHPEEYVSTFNQYTAHCDVLIHCAYWNPAAPLLFTKDEMKASDFNISVIADVTCDIDGSVPATQRPSTIADPFYDYNVNTEKLEDAFSSDITIMAVDNLPCSLPRDASEDFGKELLEKVFPSLFGDDANGIIERATICENGKLTENYKYLEEWVA